MEREDSTSPMDVLSDTSDSSSQMDELDDESTDEAGYLLPEASHLTALPAVSSRFSASMDLLAEGPATGRTSFSSYVTAGSDLSVTSESDADAEPWSRCTSISSSIRPPEIEEIGKLPPWCLSPEPRPSNTAERHAIQPPKSRRQWRLELQAKADRLLGLFHSWDLLVYGHLANPVISEALTLISKFGSPGSFQYCRQRLGDVNFIPTSEPQTFRDIFGTDGFKKSSLRLDVAIENWSWLRDLFEPNRNHNTWDGHGRRLPPLADHDPNVFQICLQLAKVYHADTHGRRLPPLADHDPNVVQICLELAEVYHTDIFHEVKNLVTLYRSKDDNRLTFIILHSLTALFERSHQTGLHTIAYGLGLLYLKPLHIGKDYFGPLPSTYIEEWSRLHGKEYYYGGSNVRSTFYKILKKRSSPLEVQYAVAFAISVLAADIPRCRDAFVEEGFIPILVENLTEHCGKQCNGHADAVFARALWKLATGSPANTKRIIGSNLLITSFTTLSVSIKGPLECREPVECRRKSVELLMRMSPIFSHNEDLREFYRAVYSKDHKLICEKLRIVDQEGIQYDCSNILPCIVALTSLAYAFENWINSATVYFYKGWEIIGTLIHILEKRYPGIVTEDAAILLSRHIPVRCLLHEPEIRVTALVILCCITKYVSFTELDEMTDVRTVLEWACEERYLTRDATINRMILEAKSKLDQV